MGQTKVHQLEPASDKDTEVEVDWIPDTRRGIHTHIDSPRTTPRAYTLTKASTPPSPPSPSHSLFSGSVVEEVAGFDVSVDHVVGVHVPQGQKQSPHVLPSLRHRHEGEIVLWRGREWSFMHTSYVYNIHGYDTVPIINIDSV